MSIYEPRTKLERLLRDCELGWMIDWHAPPDEAIPYLLDALAQATKESRQRFGQEAPILSQEVLEAEHAINPNKVRAFLQVLGETRTPQILVMAWRNIQGSNIAEVHISYKALQSFQLQIVLSDSHDQGRQEVYESCDIFDAAVLRHFGITKQEDAPLFDGLYPLRIS